MGILYTAGYPNNRESLATLTTYKKNIFSQLAQVMPSPVSLPMHYYLQSL